MALVHHKYPSVKPCMYADDHSFILFWQTPLGVGHQFPEWTILSHVNCFIQLAVIGFQVLLDSLHPWSI